MCNYIAGFAAPLVYSNFALPKNDNTDDGWQCIISQQKRLVITPSSQPNFYSGF